MQTYTVQLSPSTVQDILLYIDSRAPTMEVRFAEAFWALHAELTGRPRERPVHWRQWVVQERGEMRRAQKIEARHP